MVAITLQYVIIVTLFLFGAGVIFLGVGSFLLTVATTKDIKINLKSIDERGIFAENQSWTLSQLSDVIRLHALIKQFSFVLLYSQSKLNQI